MGGAGVGVMCTRMGHPRSRGVIIRCKDFCEERWIAGSKPGNDGVDGVARIAQAVRVLDRPPARTGAYFRARFFFARFTVS